MTVVVWVKNVDKEMRVAEQVVITDTLPAGADYEWNSALVAGRTISVEGSNPYQFHIGALSRDDEVTLRYRTLPLW